MTHPRPVRPGLDGDPNVPDLRRFSKSLRFLKTKRINAIQRVQAPFDEILLVSSGQKRKGTSYKDQFHFVYWVSHCAQLSNPALNLEVRVVLILQSSHDSWLFSCIGSRDTNLRPTWAVCAFSVGTSVRLGHHGNSGY